MLLAFVFVFPNDLPVRFVQAKHPLETADHAAVERVRRIAGARRKLAVGDINPALGHDRPRVAAADARAPADGRAVGGEFLDDAGFAPDRVAVGAEPLRPVLGEQRVAGKTPGAGRAQMKAPNRVHESRLHHPRAPGDAKTKEGCVTPQGEQYFLEIKAFRWEYDVTDESG